VPSTDIIVIFTSGETCELMKDTQKVNKGEVDIVNIKQKNEIISA